MNGTDLKTPETTRSEPVRFDDWDHELELGNDLRAEQRLVWKEIVVVLLVLAVAAVRLFLV